MPSRSSKSATKEHEKDKDFIDKIKEFFKGDPGSTAHTVGKAKEERERKLREAEEALGIKKKKKK